jgi:uncharacterized protein YbbC (DUF1343 family)
MKVGLDKLVENCNLLTDLGRIGIVTNQAVTSSQFVSAAEVISRAAGKANGARVTAVFGPQHGYGQTEQDNMRETPDTFFQFEDGSQVPLFSLYSQTRMPTVEQLSLMDTLVIDLLDIGCRVYTYMETLAGCLRATAPLGKKVVVLDRPNPLGLCHLNERNQWQRVEGNLLDMRWESFVGWYSIPMRHGLTLGELGHYFIASDKLKIDYRVIAVDNLFRKTSPTELSQLTWTMPSPNIPTWESAFLFPSFVTLEATNISEGRGTTLPFQIIGAPYLDTSGLQKFFRDSSKLNGPLLTEFAQFDAFVFRPHDFRPTFNKHAGNLCKGIQIHCINPERAHLFSLGMHFLYFCTAKHPLEMTWNPPGYEYNYEAPPLNLILGHESWLEFFEQVKLGGDSPANRERLAFLLQNSQEQAQQFAAQSKFAHIYS